MKLCEPHIKHRTLAGAGLAFLLAFAFAGLRAESLGIELTPADILATGEGVPPPSAQGETQRKSLARDAALVSAQGRLLAYVQELRKGGKAVGNLMRSDRKFEIKVKGALSRFAIVKTEWQADDRAVVTIRLAKKDLKKIRIGVP